jgi:prepilin-type N-terminal cleavage/methylation domain-containing protein
MGWIKIRYSEKGFTLVELLISLAILGVVVLASTGVLHMASQSNQTVLTDIGQVKQAREAIDSIMDEIHYSQRIEEFTNTSIAYTDFNGIDNTILSYNTATGTLTVQRGASGTPITIVNGGILKKFTVTQATYDTNIYSFSMTFRYNPNDVTKDLNVTTTVKPFTYQ